MKEAGYSEKEIQASFDKACAMKVFTYKGERDTLMTPRDSILHHKRIMRAAMVAMDPPHGAVKAYVGGPNFRYFKYDMAKQGKRQIGSTIKPFVYTFAIDLWAYALHDGPEPADDDRDGQRYGLVAQGGRTRSSTTGVLHPLRWGLARSRNNYSAWIMKQAKQPEAVADFIHNMVSAAISTRFRRWPLGTSGVERFRVGERLFDLCQRGACIPTGSS